MTDQLDCEFAKVCGHKDRLEDVPLLVAHFLKKYNREFKNEITAISDDILTICGISMAGKRSGALIYNKHAFFFTTIARLSWITIV
jgi:hypothetical protein